jgi:hypothetical protein
MSSVIPRVVGCPVCGAKPGEDCNDPHQNHEARVHEFIENAGYLDRLEAHLESHRDLATHGIRLDERESIYLTDEEILGIYGERNG